MGYNTINFRCFIKLDNETFLPFTNSTSSNCTYINSNGREVKVKETQLQFVCKKQDVTLNDIDNWLDDSVKLYHNTENKPIEEIEQYLGYYLTFYTSTSRELSKTQLRNFFKNGLKESMTIEELNKISIKEISISATVNDKHYHLTTTKEIKEFLSKPENKYTYLKLNNSNEVRRLIVENNKRNKNNTIKEYAKKMKYLLFCKVNGYIMRSGNERVYYVEDEKSATNFHSNKRAQDYNDKLVKEKSLNNHEIIKIEV